MIQYDTKSPKKQLPLRCLKEAIFLVDGIRSKSARMKNTAESTQSPMYRKSETMRNLRRKKEYLDTFKRRIRNLSQTETTQKVISAVCSTDGLPLTKLTHSFSLKKLWIITRTQEIAQALRYKTETFSFFTLFSRSKNVEAAFSSLEENVLLLAYEKNLIRMLYFLCRDMFFYWQINRYDQFFNEKLDIYTRNLYLNKLKVWMNSDIFKTSYKYNEVEKYLWRPDDFGNSSQIPNPSLFRKSMEFFQNKFSRRWKTLGDREKVKMSNILSYYPLSNVFKRISQSYSLLISSTMNQKDFIHPLRYKSPYLRYLTSEVICDVVAQFKMLNVTEPWILHSVQISKSSSVQIDTFLTTITQTPENLQYMQASSKHENITNSAPLVTNAPTQFLFREKHKLFFLPKDIQEATRRIQQIIEFTTMQRVVLEYASDKVSNTIHLPATRFPQAISASMIKLPQNDRSSLYATYSRQKRCFLSFYDTISHLQKTHVSAMEYMYGISKSLKYTIAQDHLRLVLSVAKSPKYRSIDMPDLLQEGMLGLTKAVERFQLDRGYQFTTYATWWVHQALNRVTLISNHIIPLPTHIQRKVHLILAASTNLSKKLNREPYVEEIATELRLPVQKIYQLIQTSALSRRFLSLDQTIRAGDPRTYLAMLQTPTVKTPVDLTPLFLYFSSLLSPRESAILRLRLGLYPFKRHSLDQLAKVFSVPREKIKSIEKSSFDKIRNAIINLPAYPAIFDLVGKSLTSF